MFLKGTDMRKTKKHGTDDAKKKTNYQGYADSRRTQEYHEP